MIATCKDVDDLELVEQGRHGGQGEEVRVDRTSLKLDCGQVWQEEAQAL